MRTTLKNNVIHPPRICVACGKTSNEVNFATKYQKNGSLYFYPRCLSCAWRYRHKSIKRPPTTKLPATARVRVLWCPHKEFQRDNEFDVGDFKNTLKEGFWPLGMIVGVNGNQYAVCGNGVVIRTLERLGYPQEYKLPKQWLRSI